MKSIVSNYGCGIFPNGYMLQEFVTYWRVNPRDETIVLGPFHRKIPAIYRCCQGERWRIFT